MFNNPSAQFVCNEHELFDSVVKYFNNATQRLFPELMQSMPDKLICVIEKYALCNWRFVVSSDGVTCKCSVSFPQIESVLLLMAEVKLFRLFNQMIISNSPLKSKFNICTDKRHNLIYYYI